MRVCLCLTSAGLGRELQRLLLLLLLQGDRSRAVQLEGQAKPVVNVCTSRLWAKPTTLCASVQTAVALWYQGTWGQ